MIDAKTGGK